MKDLLLVGEEIMKDKYIFQHLIKIILKILAQEVGMHAQ
jgi:hypothetical protein